MVTPRICRMESESAQVYPESSPIPLSKVADPRPEPIKSSQDSRPGPSTYQHLHIPMKMMEDFLRLASENTQKNLETCGVLVGFLKNWIFHITTVIIPKQESTSDSCSTLNEEEIFEVQDSLSLFPLGWIHTHPSQTCFVSSVDLHTHYSYQVIWHYYYYSNSVTIHIVDFAGAVCTSLLLRLWKRKRNSCNNAR
ncbi:hypothetical protein HN873_039641 [Arachis hypogaea]